VAKIAVDEGLLSSIFIKTALMTKCELFCNKPFVMTSIVHKTDGYMISFYYDEGSIRGDR
jgi:hypothetical protein